MIIFKYNIYIIDINQTYSKSTVTTAMLSHVNNLNKCKNYRELRHLNVKLPHDVNSHIFSTII